MLRDRIKETTGWSPWDRRGRHCAEIGGPYNGPRTGHEVPRCYGSVSVRAVAHVLQRLTDLDKEATVMFVDRVGAFEVSHVDWFSRCPWMLPFILQFSGRPSKYIWEDEQGEVHEMFQGEGGEQGDH